MLGSAFGRCPRRGSLWLLAVLCAALGAGCSADANTGSDSSGAEGNVEIFSWWIAGGELEALKAVLALHSERHPRATVTNAASTVAEAARERLSDRMADGNPPDTFQANTGADLLNTWVLANGNDDATSKVENLQGIAEARGWSEDFYPEVLRAASHDGKLRAVPVNIHRINSLVIRKDLFEKHGLEVPRSIPELYATCERILRDDAIQAEAPDGDRMACLGLGNKWDWTLSLMTFEMILPALTSADYYEQFWSGKKSGRAPELIEALQVALHLYCGGEDTSNCSETSYFNSDVDDVTWPEGVLKIADKTAMMAAMGDWAKGLLESEGLEAGEEFDVVPFPGSEDAFVFTSDTFPLPKGAPNRRGALALLETFVSPAGQVMFNKLKGSIPVRKDSAEEEFDEVTRATILDFRRAKKVLALSGLLAADQLPDLASELKASMQRGSIEIIQNYVRANYELLKR